MIKRLRRRFIRIAMIAVTSVLLVLSITVNIANFISVDSGLKQMLAVIGDNRGTIPPVPRGDKPGDKPDGRFTQETPYSTRYFVLRYSDSGELVKADLDKIASVTEDDVGKYLSVAVNHGEGYGYISGYRYRVVNEGEGRRMAIFLDCRNEFRSVAKVAVLSFVIMIVCIALVYIIVVLFSRRAIDPVVRASERQKQFITDAGHELKTPITVIAASLKVLEMENGSQKWIDKAQAQTERLKELVNSLVTLSRMDEEESPLHMSAFDISGAVTETAESFCDYAESCGHSLVTDIAPDITYNGDEYAVRQLVSVLLDNAIKYSSDSSPITLSLRRGKKGVIIRESNSCDGIEPQELDRLFDRFYRTDKSRTAGGFGIGLSLARSIAEGHRGSIRAESTDGKNINFIAELK